MDQIQEKEDSVLSVSDAVLFAKNEVASMPSMTLPESDVTTPMRVQNSGM